MSLNQNIKNLRIAAILNIEGKIRTDSVASLAPALCFVKINEFIQIEQMQRAAEAYERARQQQLGHQVSQGVNPQERSAQKHARDRPTPHQTPSAESGQAVPCLATTTRAWIAQNRLFTVRCVSFLFQTCVQ